MGCRPGYFTDVSFVAGNEASVKWGMWACISLIAFAALISRMWINCLPCKVDVENE